MTTTTADWLLESPEFLAFSGCWRRDGRAPLGLADWLRDHDLPACAAACDWAAAVPDRAGVRTGEDLRTATVAEWGGVRPVHYDGTWQWCSQDDNHVDVTTANPVHVRSALPHAVFSAIWAAGGVNDFPSFAAAVHALLVAWAAVNPC